MRYICTKCDDELCSGPLPNGGCLLYALTLFAGCVFASTAVALWCGWAVVVERGDNPLKLTVPGELGELIAFVLVVCVFPFVAPFVLHALFARIDRRVRGNPPCPKCGPTTWERDSTGFEF